MTSSKPTPLPFPEEASAPPPPKRMRRSTELFDMEGTPVHIRLTCLCCKELKPLAEFGLRKMPNNTLRNQPWCRSCRSTKRPVVKAIVEEGAIAEGDSLSS
ncbi:MAG: hypothetical protein FWD46_02600 [Cystobacterineae bacterium]|nr:hypothetical protein [Cystobacterineae bacterium]